MGELITVKKTEEKKSSGGKPFIRVQDARGRWLTKWGTGAPAIGQVFMAEIRSEQRDGNTFHTIDSWMPHQAGTVSLQAGQAPNANANGATVTVQPSKDRIIEAECALRAAVDASRSWVIGNEAGANTVNAAILQTADMFLAWLLANDGTRTVEEPF